MHACIIVSVHVLMVECVCVCAYICVYTDVCTVCAWKDNVCVSIYVYVLCMCVCINTSVCLDILYFIFR
jgi:hypothetical protein